MEQRSSVIQMRGIPELRNALTLKHLFVNSWQHRFHYFSCHKCTNGLVSEHLGIATYRTEKFGNPNVRNFEIANCFGIEISIREFVAT